MAQTYKKVTCDSTGSGSGGGTGSAFYVDFLVADWTLSGTYYFFTVLESNHNKGINPGVQVYLDNTIDHELVDVGVHINSSGDVEIRVTSSPDNRFDGRIIILE